MPVVTKDLETYWQNGYSYKKLFQVQSWINEKPSDVHLMQAHPYDLDRREVRWKRARVGYELQLPNAASDAPNVAPWGTLGTTCAQKSYGKFRGKLYEGSAALGITIAQWRQSAEQMRGYYRDLAGRQETMARVLTRGWKPKVIADRWLEFIFGAVPLYSDIHATATTVINTFVDPIYVRAAGSGTTFQNLPPPYARLTVMRYRHTRAGKVSVSNPNLWLQERAGLLNPAAVVWDAVPWTFAVNMFVNINQLIQQITDYSGLSFSDYTETVTMEYRQVANYPMTAGSYAGKYQHREIASWPVPPRSLQFRLPEANWQTVATAAALATQRYGKLKRLFIST